MREILFRGKRIDNGEWVEGFYLALGTKYHYIMNGQLDITRGYPDLMKHPVDPATVGQYTGLIDKNGKRIFEGDILRHNVQGDILVNFGVVNWDESNGRWANRLNTMNPCFYMHNPAAYKVIGNIHDNPELVERESNDSGKSD